MLQRVTASPSAVTSSVDCSPAATATSAAKAPGLAVRRPGAVDARCNADVTCFHATLTSNVAIVGNAKKEIHLKIKQLHVCTLSTTLYNVSQNFLFEDLVCKY